MSKSLARPYLKTLAAGEIWHQPGQGEMILIDRAGSPVDVEFLDSYGNVIGEATGLTSGTSIGPEDEAVFHQVNVKSATAQEVKILIYRGRVSVPRMVGETTDIPASRMEQSAVTVPAGQTAAVLTAASDRLFLNVHNPDTAGGVVWVRSDNATAAGGIPVDVAGSVALKYNGPLYVYNPTAAAVTVQIGELLK